jgi:uncharacterized protein
VNVKAETRLPILLRTMRPRLHDGVFVFVSLAPGSHEPSGLHPVLRFIETEGLTLVMEQAEAQRAGLTGAFRCRMITLEVRSALNAVGFLASITSALAAQGLSANVVSAFHHDHLFVEEASAERALAVLDGFSQA